MSKEMILALNEIMTERQLPQETIRQALESALVSAYRKEVGASSAQEISAQVDLTTGELHIKVEKEVVETVENPGTEVALSEARQIDPAAEIGDMIMVETPLPQFGRVAAQTARQVIQQRIREAERETQAAHFKRQIGEIISGVVQAYHRQGYTIGLDMHAEGILPDNQKIPGERFNIHERIRAIVLDVKAENRTPRIILSRSHKNFLRRLLENEVPEIYHGIVEIRAIAREAGKRAKVAVSANQPGLDPVGACVGVRGVRIQTIVRELNDEKIDIIEWNPDPTIYIAKALSPANITGVYIQEDAPQSRTATVVVSDDQLSLAIGRNGQNARLAAKLTGWRIDIKNIAEAASEILALLEKDETLRQALPIAAEEIPEIEEVLAKHAETQHLTLDGQVKLAQFIDRVEKYRQQRRAAAQKIREAESKNIPAALFERPFSELDIPEYVFNILSEDGYASIGDFLLTAKIAPDKIFKKAGIGDKARGYIQQALDNLLQEAQETDANGAPSDEQEASVTEKSPAETADEPTEPATERETASPDEETAQDVEKLFKTIDIGNAISKEDEAKETLPEEPKKKKKKKKKKKRYYEYDPDLDATVPRRKRHDDPLTWDEDDW